MRRFVLAAVVALPVVIGAMATTAHPARAYESWSFDSLQSWSPPARTNIIDGGTPADTPATPGWRLAR